LVEGVDASTQYDHLFDFRVARFNGSIQHNSPFFYSPFSGILVSPARFSFPVRMMANPTGEFPKGSLTKKQLKSFSSITGESGKFK
jgi:hypothetical protein